MNDTTPTVVYPQIEDRRESTDKKNGPQQLLLLGLFGLVISALGTYGSLSYFSSPKGVEQAAAVAAAESRATQQDQFASINLEARAAYVFDVHTDTVLFALNEEAQLPLASITKLMTALIVSERLPDNAAIQVGTESLEQEGDSGFIRGEVFRMQDLLAFTLIESSNDGAHALALTASGGADISTFVEAMNERALSLGLTQTYFRNPTGLDSTEKVSGGYGSALDTALLTAHLLKQYPRVIEQTRYATLELTSKTNGVRSALNTNSAIGIMPGLIASKTGYTDLAGGNLVVAFDGGLNHPIVVVVLGSTEEGRFRDVRNLMTASVETLRAVSLANDSSKVQ